MAGQSSGKRPEVGRGTAETVAELVVVDREVVDVEMVLKATDAELVVVDCEVVEVEMVLKATDAELDAEVDNDGEEDNPASESLHIKNQIPCSICM